MSRDLGNQHEAKQRDAIARNMSDAIAYLISVATRARFEVVAETLEKARRELDAFDSFPNEEKRDGESRNEFGGNCKEAKHKSTERSA
jgi:hypothetical protein